MAARRRPTAQMELFLLIDGGATLEVKPDIPAKNSSVPTEADIDAMFVEWYAAYPRHVAPKPARKAFGKVIRSGEATLEQMIEGARAYGEERRRAGKGPEWIAHPATWLNAGRWLDERQPAYSPATASAARVGLEYRARAGLRR